MKKAMKLTAVKNGDQINVKYELPMSNFNANDTERAASSMMKAINAQLEFSGSEWRLEATERNTMK